MTVSKRTRFEVLRRDNYTCRYCRSADNPLRVDHVTPVALGGTDDPTNLVAACQDCNAGKASTSPDEHIVANVADDAIRWSKAIAQVARNRARATKRRDAYVQSFANEWSNWTGWNDQPIPKDEGWRATLWQFYELGLPAAEVVDAIQIACGNSKISTYDTWRYFCGVCWRKVTAIQEAARAVVLEQGASDGA